MNQHEIENHLASLEARVVEVENQFKEVQKAKGIPGAPGARGPAGNIEAAVSNATEAAKEVATVSARQVRAEFEAFKSSVNSDITRLRGEFEAFKKSIDASIKNAAENAVIVIASEYKLVSALDGKPVRIN